MTDNVDIPRPEHPGPPHAWGEYNFQVLYELIQQVREIEKRLGALEYHCLPLPLDSYTKQ